MSLKLRHIALFILMLQSMIVYAVEGRPKMRLACLDKQDSTLSLLWHAPTDNCGSFYTINLYGREDAFTLFTLLKTYYTPTSNISIKLKNLKNWQFYLVYSKACNGTDSIYSDTIMIDQQEPNTMDVDSVSVDLNTQKTLIGWTKNTSQDTKGYFVYYITATNQIIDNTSQTSILDNGGRNPNSGSLAYGVAAYDTCNNTSLISTAHKTIFLSTIYDQCNKSVNLSWTPYVGNTVLQYEIFLKINSASFQKIGAVIANINQFTYNFNSFGDTLCFYIRAIMDKNGNTITSSSNKACVNTSSIIASQNSYIAYASVQNKQVELVLIAPSGSSMQKVNIYKSQNNSAFSLWQSIAHTGGILQINDNAVDVGNQTYSYYYTTEGPCQLIFDTSNIAKTILLHVDMATPGVQNIDWSLYSDFIKGTNKQELLLLNNPNGNKSSTWNIINSFSPIQNFHTDNHTFSTQYQELCYCIRAIENQPNANYNRQDTSYSNISCATAEPIIYFPNAIQINGFNTEFLPSGVFIDYTKSSFQIYNRWGEIIYETKDIRKAWKGTNYRNDFVQSDVYVYKATIVGINGKILYFNGTITVLK